MRTSRERAIDGLRAIAKLEEYVAAEIDDEDGYYGEMAARLRRSAERRRAAVTVLRSQSEPAHGRPHLRLVTSRDDTAARRATAG